MLSALAPHVSKVKYLVGSNSSAILTGVGVVGTAATAVLTGHASFKASKILEAEKGNEARKILNHQQALEGKAELVAYPPDPRIFEIKEDVKLSKTEMVKAVWPLYLPPAAVGLLTVSSIIVAHRIDAKKIAAFAMAAGVSERALQEYKDKIEEKFTDKQVATVKDEIAKDRIEKVPVTKQTIIVGGGDVLVFDAMSGRYFYSSMDAIKKAEADTLLEIAKYDQASLSHFYDLLGWDQTAQSSLIGWNTDNPIEIEYSMQMSSDDRPAIVVDFRKMPMSNYDDIRR